MAKNLALNSRMSLYGILKKMTEFQGTEVDLIRRGLREAGLK